MVDFVNIANPSRSFLPPPPPRSVSTDSEAFRQWIDTLYRKLSEFMKNNDTTANQFNAQTSFTGGVNVFGRQGVTTNSTLETYSNQLSLRGGVSTNTAPMIGIDQQDHYYIGQSFINAKIYGAVWLFSDGTSLGSGQLRNGAAMPATYLKGIIVGYQGGVGLIPIITYV